MIPTMGNLVNCLILCPKLCGENKNLCMCINLIREFHRAESIGYGHEGHIDV